MSPVTGLARLPGRILWCVHMGNFSPVDRDEFKKRNQNIVLFATFKAFWTLVTLLIKLIGILLKWKYKIKTMPVCWPLCCESEAILFKTISSRSLG